MDILVTYALLSTIKEKRSNLTSLIDIFKELTEAIIAEFGNNKGLLDDLKKAFDEKYEICIPFPTIKIILKMIRKEKGKDFILYDDFSFISTDNCFQTLEEEIIEEKSLIDDLQSMYRELCEDADIKNYIGIDYFIDLNRRDIIAYITDSRKEIHGDREFDLFKALFAIEKYKSIIEKLVLGSIISTYIEIDINESIDKKLLLLDTNFIISLLDLHSIESNSNTKEIMKIAIKHDYRIEVLPETIKEVRNLLKRKADRIHGVTLFTQRDKNTIESGCARRGLGKQELDLYIYKLERILVKDGVRIINLSENNRLLKEALKTDMYQKLKDRPYNRDGVIHDVMAMCYIKKNRKDGEKGFKDTSSFFVTDSHGYLENKISNKTELPYIIKAEELLNILWLLNPTSNSFITRTNIANIFSIYLDKKLPSREMLKKMDRKITALDELPIDLDDCVDIAVNISVNDTKELDEILGIEEDLLLKEKLVSLAAKKNNENNEELKLKIANVNKVVEIMDTKLSAKEIESKKKEEDILRIKKDTEQIIEENEQNSLYQELKTKKVYLDELIKRDIEEKERLNEDLEELNDKTFNVFKILRNVMLIMILSPIVYIGIYFIIPNWENIEPISFIITLIIPIIMVFLGIKEKQFNIIKIIKKTSEKIQPKRMAKQKKISEKITIIEDRVLDYNNELSNIII